METYIQISNLNDFIFCPRSIYFHNLYYDYDENNYKETVQINGTSAHQTIDNKIYSTKKCLLQNIEVYSEKYNLMGKIDMFDSETGKLTERKREIKVIYDGYIFQLYAQYFCLTEMNYNVKSLYLYDYVHNKNYSIKLPEEDLNMLNKFETLIHKINNYDIINDNSTPNINKCQRCIYSKLCNYNLLC
jgi:CRISPR-associated protein Cas4